MYGLYKLLKRKRGVSPVIAVVLLIALTVAAAAVIWAITNDLIGGGGVAITGQVVDADNDGTNTTVRVKLTITSDATWDSAVILDGTTVVGSNDSLNVLDPIVGNNDVTETILFQDTGALSGNFDLEITFIVDGNTETETFSFSV